METKIIKVVFGGRKYTTTAKRTRTDYGQMFEFVDINLPDTFEVIFSNSNTSAGTGKKMIGSNQRCLIPDEYLKTGQPIYAWVLVHDDEDDGRHMYSIKSPVDDMPDTSPEEPTPVEQSVISQAISALNSAVTTTTQKASEAAASADRAEQAAEGAEGYAERAESAQQAAESARDRATQAETSARTSAATASEKASEAISSATTASQSAMTAENASESAQEYATASAENASQASQSADTASSKAQEASGYASSANTDAQTASQKASEAAQSASTATQAKTDAETAKQASETAQGLAESARDGAVTAKNDTESARDEAQEIADGITGKVEQIDSNTDRIESLEDDRYKPYAVDSASGSIANFPDGADNIPLKSCIVRVEPVQAGSGDPSPENVRPITGWTGCEVQRTGINIFDGEMENGDINSNTGENSGTSTSRYRSKNYIPIRAGAYYFKSPNRTGTVRVFFYDANKTFIYFMAWSVNAVNIIDSERVRYARFRFSTAKVDGDEQIAINYPSTDTDYHSGTDNETYPITFPTEAGTIYGGYVDVTGGELVVDRAIVDLGTLTWSYNSSNQFFFAFVSGRLAGSNNLICTNYPYGGYKSDSGMATADNKYLYRDASSSTAIKIKDTSYTDATTFKTAMGGVMLVYELATPIHYPLTPTEIKTLLGQNNVWADTGDVSVEYRADTRLYIEKLTQPEEDDMIADSAISDGQFFMVGNSLYRALANIASGATITVGTNAQRVSLSDALNLVNA